jgi:autotransporter-associated beta strand protein
MSNTPLWHFPGAKFSLRQLIILSGVLCVLVTNRSDATTPSGGCTTTMVLTYQFGAPARWVARMDPLATQAFQLDFTFDPARAQLVETAGTGGIIYKFPFNQTTPPDISQLGNGRILDIAGSAGAVQGTPGDSDIFELVFLDLQPGLPITSVAFTVSASANDFVTAVDPATNQQIVYGPGQITPTTRTVTPGISPHVWDPDTLYNNGNTGGPGQWNTTSNSWDDIPLPLPSPTPSPTPPPLSDTPWDNATHSHDLAVFGGNVGSGVVVATEPISVGGFQFDNTGYDIQGGPLSLSSPTMTPPPVIDTGANSATISAVLQGFGFSKVGSGKLTITGANTYSGGTVVNAGVLFINNVSGSGTGSGQVMVNGGALGGTGSVGGVVMVHPAGSLLAGDGTTASGTLNIGGSMLLDPGSVVRLALGPGGTHSTLHRGGGSWSFAPNQAFTFINLGAQPGVYQDIITGLAMDPGGEASWIITNPGLNGQFIYDGAGHIDLNITAAPPPLTLSSVVSRKMHGGAGTFDIPLPVGVECRSSGGMHQLVFSFSNPITGAASASVTSGVGLAGSPNVAGNTVTVNVTGVTNLQTITVTLSNVTDNAGGFMSSVAVDMKVAAGDTTSNGGINASDVSQTKNRVGMAVSAATFRNDLNANGSINASDVSLVKLHSGESLP